MKTKFLSGLTGLVFMLLLVGSVQAATVTLTLDGGQYDNGDLYDYAASPVTYDIGSFDFASYLTNGEIITGAVIEGFWDCDHAGATYGTAHNYIELDGIQVADTADSGLDFRNLTYDYSWSYEFTDFSIFNDGSADLTATQYSPVYTWLGATTLTLTIQAAPVPLPISALIFATGLASVAGIRRKKA